jgi:signal transduction histidine kinase
LLEGLDELLIKVVRVSGYQLVMLEDASRKFNVLQEYPRQGTPYVQIIGLESPLLNYFRVTGAEQLALNLPSENGFPASQEKEARATLAEAGAEFCFPFMVSTEPFGLLFLKERTEGKRYTATDIHLLGMLSRNLSLALNQIRLKNQILQAQEAELLGRMSRGMAHDMNNLVTPVQTLMQLMAEGVPIESLRDELLPLATRSIDTLREYIREALFFSENARADFKLGRLDMVLAEAAGIVAPRCEQKGIKLTVVAPAEALVEMDKSLIKRTIANVLGNAIDASSTGTEIRVELDALEKTEPERDWFRIRVIDQGEGIDPANMSRVFTPYFTTKNRGDEQRGFGLGLSICRKVVQIHGGSLKIASEPKKGTTVSIDLPDHQPRKPASQLEPVT